MLKYCVISHTHWDREWYEPFDSFRLRLVQLIDHCLKTLRDNPDFIFHLDAQTIVLEDYLEMRPSRREELAARIREERLIVGPWYLQNDFYLTSGEATVRNLLTGIRIAEEFGACGKTGYMPDQFGLISQIPQIMQEFGIQSAVFGRGYNEFDYLPDGTCTRRGRKPEFLWKAPDGSSVLAVQLKDWYNNAQRFSAQISRAERMVQNIRKSFDGLAQTPYLLLMNGVDHLEAQDDLLPILKKLNRRLPEGESIEQMRLDTYLRDVQSYIKKQKLQLPVHEGEICGGHDEDILKGTHSSRISLKQENAAAQDMLECTLEPVYAMLERFGAAGVYQKETFDYLWKGLMKNHPHDSICCCGRDEIAEHMADRFARLRETTAPLLTTALRLAAEHTELAARHADGYLVLVANPTERERSELVHAVVDIPASENWRAVRLLDADGTEIPFMTLSERTTLRDTRSPVNLPGTIEVVRREIVFRAEAVAPFAFRAYQVAEDQKERTEQTDVQRNLEMENDALRVTVSETGTVDVLVKKTGRMFHDVLQAEDAADRGDSYLYRETGLPRIYSSEFPAEVKKTEQNSFWQTIEIARTLLLPSGYNVQKQRRNDELLANRLVLSLRLEAGSDILHVSYRLDNRSKDHRLRLLVQSGIRTEYSYADTPFAVERYRNAGFDPASCDHSRCASTFAMLRGEKEAAAVLHKGNYEYEHLTQGTLAFTLVRSTGVITCDADGTFHNGDEWRCPGNQSIGLQQGAFGLLFADGTLEPCDAAYRAKCWRNPMPALAAPCDPKKFTGGRFAVQDTQVAELFFLPDEYPKLHIPDNQSCLRAEGHGLLVTALKKAEKGRGFVLRFVNLADTAQQAEVFAAGRIQPCTLAEKTNGTAAQDVWTAAVPAQKIISLQIHTSRRNQT